jgi:hypothetical protein
MHNPRRWENAFVRRGSALEEFVNDYFAPIASGVLLFAGTGFDPRARVIPEILGNGTKGAATVFMIREERPGAKASLISRAEATMSLVAALFAKAEKLQFDVFADDNAVIAGFQLANALRKLNFPEAFSSYSDIVLDFSSLSVGVIFPLAKLLFELADNGQFRNLHFMGTSSPETDRCHKATVSDEVQSPRGFRLPTAAEETVGRLWIPQLESGQARTLERIRERIRVADTCPILPFPTGKIREPEDLILEFQDQLNAWEVHRGDVIYAAEDDPLDIYRVVGRVTQEREQVFMEAGGSEVIVTPMGSKIVAMGLLLAALEYDLGVRYVETVSYDVSAFPPSTTYETLSLWLHGGPQSAPQ